MPRELTPGVQTGMVESAASDSKLSWEESHFEARRLAGLAVDIMSQSPSFRDALLKAYVRNTWERPIEVKHGDSVYSFKTRYVEPQFMGVKIAYKIGGPVEQKDLFLGAEVFDLELTRDTSKGGRIVRHERASVLLEQRIGTVSFTDVTIGLEEDKHNIYVDRDRRAVSEMDRLLKEFAKEKVSAQVYSTSLGALEEPKIDEGRYLPD